MRHSSERRNSMCRRFFDEVTVISDDPSQVERLWQRYWSYSPELSDVVPLKPTAFEIQTIELLLTAAGQFVDSLGLVQSKHLSAERILVLDGDEFREKIDPAAGGMIRGGWAYLIRGSNKEFAHDASHEIAHLASFQRIRVTRREDNGRELVHIAPERSGMSSRVRMNVAENTSGADVPIFVGLNEAITELVARHLRFELIREAPNLLTADEADWLLETVTYGSQIRLAEHVLGLARDDDAGIIPASLLDYFTGTSTLLRRLRERCPGSVRVLTGMGTEPEDAFAAARLLGLDMG
ncbi:MAG: hypothetical protein ABIJ46_00150 [bacterium]